MLRQASPTHMQDMLWFNSLSKMAASGYYILAAKSIHKILAGCKKVLYIETMPKFPLNNSWRKGLAALVRMPTFQLFFDYGFAATGSISEKNGRTKKPQKRLLWILPILGLAEGRLREGLAYLHSEDFRQSVICLLGRL